MSQQKMPVRNRAEKFRFYAALWNNKSFLEDPLFRCTVTMSHVKFGLQVKVAIKKAHRLLRQIRTHYRSILVKLLGTRRSNCSPFRMYKLCNNIWPREVSRRFTDVCAGRQLEGSDTLMTYFRVPVNFSLYSFSSFCCILQETLKRHSDFTLPHTSCWK